MAPPMMRRIILMDPSFLSNMILWSITFCKSSQAEQIAYNSLCSYPNPNNNNCLHIKIPILTNLFLFTLSFYTVFKTAIVTVRLVEYEGAMINIPKSARAAKMCKDRYKWVAVLTIAVLVALIILEPFDGAATPWVSVAYAASGAGLVGGYYVLKKNWWAAIVAEDRDGERPA